MSRIPLCIQRRKLLRLTFEYVVKSSFWITRWRTVESTLISNLQCNGRMKEKNNYLFGTSFTAAVLAAVLAVTSAHGNFGANRSFLPLGIL